MLQGHLTPKSRVRQRPIDANVHFTRFPYLTFYHRRHFSSFYSTCKLGILYIVLKLSMSSAQLHFLISCKGTLLVTPASLTLGAHAQRGLL